MLLLDFVSYLIVKKILLYRKGMISLAEFIWKGVLFLHKNWKSQQLFMKFDDVQTTTTIGWGGTFCHTIAGANLKIILFDLKCDEFYSVYHGVLEA